MRRISVWGPALIASLMLLWALKPDNSYGYYVLLRWVCCAVFAYLAFQALAQEKQGWFWVLGITAVVYNPIVRVHLTREIWSIMNVITIGLAVASFFALKVKDERRRQEQQPKKRDVEDAERKCQVEDLAQDDWTGRTVLLKGNKTVEIGQIDNNGRQVFLAELGQINYCVIKQQGGSIKVSENGLEGWFDKADAVVLEEAVDYFTGRILANANDTQAYVYRAVAWEMKGDFDLAIKDYNDAIRFDPESVIAHINRGNAWRRKKDYDKAIKDYDEGIRLDPKCWFAYANRGLAWSGKEDCDRAIKDFDEAIRLGSKYVFVYSNRGLAWYDKNEYDKAIKDFNEAIRLDPKNFALYMYRGWAWSRKKDYDKAIKDFDDVLRLNPKDVFAYCKRGLAWSGKKYYDKAIKNYDEAIRLDPKYAFAYRSLRGYSPRARKKRFVTASARSKWQ